MAVVPQAADADIEENWDEDFEFQQASQAVVSDPLNVTSSNGGSDKSPLKDRKNVLSQRADVGPSTPSRRRRPSPPENWDEDFHDRDATNSPQRRSVRGRRGLPDGENWDADFEDGDAEPGQANGNDPGKGTHDSWGSSDDEDEFGSRGLEDDPTVTSRSRSTPVRLSPVPPHSSPFARSPTVSVFSVPSSTGHDYSSTAHLNRYSGGASSLALLPPSPPVQRERRRLRKKSRPPSSLPGVYRLEDLPEISRVPPLPVQPSTPEHKAGNLPEADSTPTPPASTRTPLLSRVGSLGKRWGAGRKKRASMGAHEAQMPEHPASPGASSPRSTAKSGWFFRAGGADPGPSSPPRVPLALKHELSFDKLLDLVSADRSPEIPSRSAKPSQQVEEPVSVLKAKLPHSSSGQGDTGRPAPGQISVSTSQGSGSSWSSSSYRSKRSSVPRHASYGHDLAHGRQTPENRRSSSRPRSASASVNQDFDPNRSTLTSRTARKLSKGREPTEQDRERCNGKPSYGRDDALPGSRSFMDGMRRISLVGISKHKPQTSTAPETPPKHRRTPSRSSRASMTMQPTAGLNGDQGTPRAHPRIVRSSSDALLLPIELRPASPPRVTTSASMPIKSTDTLVPDYNALEPGLSVAASLDHRRSRSPSLSPLPSPSRPQLSTSPHQAASLGRTAIPPKEPVENEPAFPRRNSLGDLKIPPRISRAQVSLRRDLGMVRDFAASVEQLKQLQNTYHGLVDEVHTLIENAEPAQSRAMSPTLLNLPKTSPVSRTRSNTNPPETCRYNQQELSTALNLIVAKYQISWECAELLIELGSGTPPTPSPEPSHRNITPLSASSLPDGRPNRERAVTLSGDETKPNIRSPIDGDTTSPPLASPLVETHWHATTGHHDLSSRQLLLLHEMLTNPESSVHLAMEAPPEEVNHDWRWGDPMNSTVTLPSEESTPVTRQPAMKKRKLGMRGLRDMLKALKKSYSEQPHQSAPWQVGAVSSTSISLSTSSSVHSPRYPSVTQRRRARTGIGSESMKATREGEVCSPYGISASSTHKSSPRRPSLASIFRLGQRSKSQLSTHDPSSEELRHQRSASDMGSPARSDEDWDHIDPIEHLDQSTSTSRPTTDGAATVRGRGKRGTSPHQRLQQRKASDTSTSMHRSPSTSQISLYEESGHPLAQPHPRKAISYAQLMPGHQNKDPRLPSTSKEPGSSHRRRPSHDRKGGHSSSVRSAPPQWAQSQGQSSGDVFLTTLPDSKLAMTPENIQPLLENAKEVHARCRECISELSMLLTLNADVEPRPPSQLP